MRLFKKEKKLSKLFSQSTICLTTFKCFPIKKVIRLDISTYNLHIALSIVSWLHVLFQRPWANTLLGPPELLEKSAKKNEKYFTYFFFITNPLSIVVYLCRGEESGHLLWSLSWILPFKKMSLPFYFQKIVFPKRPISCYSLFDLRLSHWVLKLQQVPKIYHGIKYHLGQWIIIHLPIGRINFIYPGMYYVWS